jgi:hypothetical protein
MPSIIWHIERDYKPQQEIVNWIIPLFIWRAVGHTLMQFVQQETGAGLGRSMDRVGCNNLRQATQSDNQ